jgi:hypothetical protein
MFDQNLFWKTNSGISLNNINKNFKTFLFELLKRLTGI